MLFRKYVKTKSSESNLRNTHELDLVPEWHEWEAQEKTKDASEFSKERRKGVNQLLSFNLGHRGWNASIQLHENNTIQLS